MGSPTFAILFLLTTQEVDVVVKLVFLCGFQQVCSRCLSFGSGLSPFGPPCYLATCLLLLCICGCICPVILLLTPCCVAICLLLWLLCICGTSAQSSFCHQFGCDRYECCGMVSLDASVSGSFHHQFGCGHSHLLGCDHWLSADHHGDCCGLQVLDALATGHWSVPHAASFVCGSRLRPIVGSVCLCMQNIILLLIDVCIYHMYVWSVVTSNV